MLGPDDWIDQLSVLAHIQSFLNLQQNFKFRHLTDKQPMVGTHIWTDVVSSFGTCEKLDHRVLNRL